MNELRHSNVEARARAAFESKYPGATPWMELSQETRVMWMVYAHRLTQRELNTTTAAPGGAKQ
jgi:hypothetical protein